MKRLFYLTLLALPVFFAQACAITIPHHPSEALSGIQAPAPNTIVVADIGDTRGRGPTVIGSGVSYWLPVKYYAKEGNIALPVSHYLAKSLTDDLNAIGFRATLANNPTTRLPMSPDAAGKAARQAGAKYLVQTRTTEGITKYWGFLLIPFIEPVWTRVGLDVDLIDVESGEKKESFQINHKEVEWYFAKIFILDALFDAGIFGKHWHRDAWGKTVVPDALAKAVVKIAEKAK